MPEKNCWLLYSQAEVLRNKHYIELYRDACDRRGIGLRVLTTERLVMALRSGKPVLYCDGVIPEPPDFAICRVRDHLLSNHIEQMGIPVFNNAGISAICHDKRRMYHFLAANGFPILDTMWGGGLGSYGVHSNAGASLPLVLKPKDGYGGRDVFWVSGEEQFGAFYSKIGAENAIAQAAADTIGRDLRVYVMGKRVIAAVLRTSDSDFRANYGLGGNARIVEPDDETSSLVERVINLLDIGFLGIDFVFHDGHPYINELEDVVGARMLYNLTDMDVADMYVEYITSMLS